MFGTKSRAASPVEPQDNLRLCHYTSLANLIAILEDDKLTLRSPARWDDRNDAASMEAFRRKTGAAQVCAVSFASGDEQIHHWFNYACKTYGGCIHFNTAALLAALDAIPGLIHRPIRYIPQEEISAKKLAALPPEDLPFIKRRPYEAEQEYRVLWSGGPDDAPPSIPLSGLIDHLTLAPGMTTPHASGEANGEAAGKPNPFGPALADMLTAHYSGRYGLAVHQSRLLYSRDWTSLFDNV
ncbi:MAG: hypothetical protein LBD20_00245 [Spirochaetaceae bacterium]|jgi:hypothetical protein|nr:hypothetical protein [Spirochaetaceae bacterium]